MAKSKKTNNKKGTTKKNINKKIDEIKSHHAIIGIAAGVDAYPLYYDATNEKDHLPPYEGENDLNKYLYLANRVNAKVVLEVKTKNRHKKTS